MTKEGFIYILFNPSMSGLYKIGKTTRSPYERIAELNDASGVPEAFELVWAFPVKDVTQSEQLVHAALDSYRPNPNREFFKARIDFLEGACEKVLSRDGLLDEKVSPALNAKRAYEEAAQDAINEANDKKENYIKAREEVKANLDQLYQNKIAGLNKMIDEQGQYIADLTARITELTNDKA